MSNLISVRRDEGREKLTMLYIVLGFLVVVVGLLLYIFGSRLELPPDTDAILHQVFNSELPELVVGQTGYVTSDGLKIWYESILPDGSPKGTVLLFMSMGASAIEWPPKFIRMFVDNGYQLIRYDHRGTGLSDRVENWSRRNPYSIADMAQDAVAVLDALNIQKVNLIGVSMGGMIAQEVATSHPDRIASLTLLSTSGFVGDPDLPGLTSGYFVNSLIKSLPLFRYRILGGEQNLIKERLAKIMALSSDEGMDIREIAEVALYDMRKRRGISISGAIQHQAAVTISGSRYDRLQTLKVPTLVVHGTADPLVPVQHGQKLVETIPNAQGLWLDGVEHAFPYPNMDKVNEAILVHLNEHQLGQAYPPQSLTLIKFRSFRSWHL
jgi:pimeloyl-ACP methyl ester carboxylesterase